MKRWRPLAFAGTIALLLVTAACSDDEHCPALIGGGRYCLQPSTAIVPFEAQQKVEVRFRGQRETMIVELEVDPSGIRFVGLSPFGQTLLRVNYDNRTASAGKLPDTRLSPEQLIALLQLALWPADALRAGLETPLRLDECAGQRRILNRDEAVLTIDYSGDKPPYQRMQLHFHGEDIELVVETLPDGATGNNGHP